MLQESEGSGEKDIYIYVSSPTSTISLTCNLCKDDDANLFNNAIRKKSDKFPSLQINPNIWAFVTQTCHDIEKSKITGSTNVNLDPLQIAAQERLSNNPDLIIKPSNKGRKWF